MSVLQKHLHGLDVQSELIEHDCGVRQQNLDLNYDLAVSTGNLTRASALNHVQRSFYVLSRTVLALKTNSGHGKVS